MTTELHLDFETRSTVDLKKVGLHVYARHPSTDVWVAAYSFGDGPVQTWFPGEIIPEDLAGAIQGGSVWAHNVTFEMEILNQICTKRYGWPSIIPAQGYCTMVMAYAMALPGSLEKAAAAVGLRHQKDMQGHRLMLQMAQPRGKDAHGDPIWWEDHTKISRLAAYCTQDVIVERDLKKRLLMLTSDEREVWKLDQKINSRGVYVDLTAVRAAIQLVDAEKIRLDKEMRNITNNAVATCSAAAQLKAWLAINGLKIESITAPNVIDLLDRFPMPPQCRKALKLRQEAAKSSNAKLIAMEKGTGDDGRSRGLFQYHGASTGRWAGRRIQLQNLPRPKISQESIDDIFGHLGHDRDGGRDYIDLLYGPVNNAISDCLRGFLTAAPGHILYAGDFAAIEARVLAWLAGEEKVLEVFRANKDIYKETAARIYNTTPDKIDKYQRQVGKVAVLALGYQGGVNAFLKMAHTYGLKISDELARMVKYNWRYNHPHITKYWRDVDNAAKEAIFHPRVEMTAGPKGRQVTFKVAGSFMFCKLPSQRVLCYPYPKVESVINDQQWNSNAITYMGEDTFTHKWEKIKTYGGKLVENITQAVARDLLSSAMVRVEQAGYPIVMHCHDEIASEVHISQHEMPDNLLKFEKLMEVTPRWATGLPMKVETWAGKRYRK